MEDERDAEYAIRRLDRTEFGRKGRRIRVEWTKVGCGSKLHLCLLKCDDYYTTSCTYQSMMLGEQRMTWDSCLKLFFCLIWFISMNVISENLYLLCIA